MVIAISANRTSATTAKMTPGPASRVLRQRASKAIAGQDHADRRDRRRRAPGASSASRRGGRPTGRPSARRTRRPSPLTTAIGPTRRPVKYARYAPAPISPSRADRASAVGSVGRPVLVRSATTTRIVAPTSWTPAATRRLPMPAAGQGGRDVQRAPGEGGAESGQQSEGHRRSLAAPSVGPRATIPNRSPVRGRGATPRGDVAQLEEHCVRIAGVRGSSPLISTNRPYGAVAFPRPRHAGA